MLCHAVSKEIAILLRCLAPEILCTRKRPNAIFLRVEASSDSSLQLKAAVTDVSPLYLSHALAVNQVPKAFFRDVDSSVLFLFQDFRNSYTVYRYHLFDCIYMSWLIIEIPFSNCTDHTGQWGRRKESTGLRLKWLPATPTGSRIPWLNCEQSCLKGHQPKWNGSSKWRIVKRWTVLAAITGQLILYQSSSEVETK